MSFTNSLFKISIICDLLNPSMSLPSLATAAQEFLSRPLGMSSPPTTLQQTQMEVKGVNGFPSGRAEENTLPPLPNEQIYSVSVSRYYFRFKLAEIGLK
jgi:hypothetical protein